MIELRDVCFSAESAGVKKDILQNINLKIDERFVCLTGPNGSGKSTLARIIAGIVKPTSGQILFNGQDITNLTITERAKLGISFAFQQPVRFKGITVKDLVTLAAGKKLTTAECCQYLSEVGLCAQDYINLEIATMLARSTSLTLFDEPEAGIDIWSFGNLIEVFQKMYDKIQGNILIISHQERIFDIADRIIVVADGQVVADGNKDEVLPVLANQRPTVCSVLTDKVKKEG